MLYFMSRPNSASLELPPRPEVAADAAPAFSLHGVEAEGMRDASRLRGLDLDLMPGEIVGIAGIDGNGQRELEEVLVGVRPMTGGQLRVAGDEAAPGVHSLRAHGVAHLSGDREGGGLVAGLSLTENWILKAAGDEDAGRPAPPVRRTRAPGRPRGRPGRRAECARRLALDAGASPDRRRARPAR